MDPETRRRLDAIESWQKEHDAACWKRAGFIFLTLLTIIGFLYVKVMGW